MTHMLVHTAEMILVREIYPSITLPQAPICKAPEVPESGLFRP